MTLYATFVWEVFKLEKVKKIVAKFLNVDPESINQETLINYKAVRSSIMLHRMYAALADSGAKVTNASAIKTYGELLEQVSARQDKQQAKKEYQANEDTVRPTISREEFGADSLAVGIDIEDISSIPAPLNCKSNSFFNDNFSESEIDYCMMQVNPKESFATRFSLKEALIKADNTLMNMPLNELHIGNNAQGAPVYPGYVLSCSHSQDQVIAIAIKLSIENVIRTDSNYITKERVSELIAMQFQQIEKKFAWMVKVSIIIVSLLLITQLIVFNN